MSDMEKLSETVNVVARYHLDAMRRYGAGWHAPQVARHRRAFADALSLRRFIRRGGCVDCAADCTGCQPQHLFLCSDRLVRCRTHMILGEHTSA